MDRKTHWEEVYQQKQPDAVSWFQQEPGLSLQLIEKSGISLTDNIIDIGGGASVLVDRLVDKGFHNISVLDISSAALRVSQQRLGNLADNVDWITADVTEFEAEKTFNLWHDRAVFHFLTEEKDRQKYKQKLTQYISSGGNIIIASFAIGGPEKCSGLPIVQYDDEKIIQEFGAEFELKECIEEQHVTPWGSKQYFKYFRLIKINRA